MPSQTVEIVSFGHLHGPAPAAHLTIDLRHHFRDPHISPDLRHMTAHDGPVRTTVLATPGIEPLLLAALVVLAAALPLGVLA
ncbi:MAG: hypothetical protein IRZ07_27700 [Microbispora sp.]|nr:hypothetical protein [Microbispora sp.]